MITKVFSHKNIYAPKWIPFVFAFFLSACGGGGGTDETDPKQNQQESTETPAAEDSTAEEPATEEPATEESVTEEPITEEPVTEEPATEEPVTEEPATAEPPEAIEPETTLISTPFSPSNQAINTFELSSNEQNVSFEVSLNEAPFTVVDNPYLTEELDDGEHKIEVRAVTSDGVADASPAQFSWVIDTLSPDTIIDQAPDEITNSTTGEFHFSSTEDNVTYEFSLDGQNFQITLSPIIIDEVAPGEHQILIRAIDAAGNIDSTPANISWVVDTSAPETILKSSPAVLSKNALGVFEFDSNEDNVQYEVSLNGSNFNTVTSPFSTESLQEGVHNLIVQARDQAQNVDLSPVHYSWEIDTTPPSVTLHFPTPSSLTDAELLTITGIANDENNIKEVQVNGNLATSNDSFQSWQAVIPIQRGSNDVVITSEDEVGNIDARAASVEVRGIVRILRTPDRIALHKSSDTLYIVDDESILAHNLTTSTKTILADNETGTGPKLLKPRGLVIDSTNNRMLITDSELDAVISIDLATGHRSVVSDSNTNSNNPLNFPRGLALDEANDVVYLIDSGLKALVAINLSNGERTIVSNNSIGTGANFIIPIDIALDKTNSRILYTDLLKAKELLAIDIATGNRSTISGNAIGSGQSLGAAWRVAVDPTTNEGLVTDISLKAIVAINLTNGARKVLSGSAQVGPALQRPTGIFVDAETSRLFVVDDRLNVVFSVDSNTGVRNIVPIDNIGSGPSFSLVQNLFLDKNIITAVENDPYRIISIDINSGTRSHRVDNAAGSGPAILSLSHITPDTTADFILALGEQAGDATPRSKKVFKINTINGDRSVLFENFNNLGDDYRTPDRSGLVVDSNNNEVLLFIPYEEQQNIQAVVSLDSLVAVDLSQLSLREIAGPINGNGSAPVSNSITSIALSNNNDMLYMVDQEGARLMSLVLPAGTRAVISDFKNGIGSGPEIKLPEEITLNATSEIAYVSDVEQNAIFSVGLAEGLGNRQLVSGSGKGTGPLIRSTAGLSMHADRGVLFFYDIELNSIVAIEAGSGDRVIISR